MMRSDSINRNNIPLKRTINLMKNQNGLQRKVMEFIKNSHLYMDDFEYVDMDQIRLVSIYRGIAVPSIIFDSTGTKKIAALASYIIQILDELDSSIHFKLTRAMVAMFNNELNANARMIFTVHDINLMDCGKMFRGDSVLKNTDFHGIFLFRRNFLLTNRTIVRIIYLEQTFVFRKSGGLVYADNKSQFE